MPALRITNTPTFARQKVVLVFPCSGPVRVELWSRIFDRTSGGRVIGGPSREGGGGGATLSTPGGTLSNSAHFSLDLPFLLWGCRGLAGTCIRAYPSALFNVVVTNQPYGPRSPRTVRFCVRTCRCNRKVGGIYSQRIYET